MDVKGDVVEDAGSRKDTNVTASQPVQGDFFAFFRQDVNAQLAFFNEQHTDAILLSAMDRGSLGIVDRRIWLITCSCWVSVS
jgi:hypothetical protein